MTKIKTGYLPTGIFDGDNEQRLRVDFKIPNRQLNNYAAEMSKTAESRGEQALLLEAQLNQLRASITKIGDKSVSFADLRGKGINRFLTPKQIELLLEGIASLTTASFGEVEHCHRSARVVSRGDGRHLRAVELPRSAKLDGDGRFECRQVTILVPSRDTMSQAAERARQFEGRGKLVVMAESELNILRLCVVSIDGEDVEKGSLDGDQIDARFSQREQSTLVQVMNRLMIPTDGEKSDFLSTLVDGETQTAT